MKNTIVLYLRMIVVMIITLFTSRIVLNALGVDDFGTYNAVAGVVSVLTFFRSTMEKATQRFLNIEMAKQSGNVSKIFCSSLFLHIGISLIVFIIAESIGIWFLNHYMNIPQGRELAANVVFQSVVISLCLTIVSVPYSSIIIANEKMSFYAIIGVIDAILKLLFAISLLSARGDRLILYAGLSVLVSLVNILLYLLYCSKRYRRETHPHLVFEKRLYLEISKFIGWTALGQSAIICTIHGNNILINMFHGVSANAAMAIGSQVNSAVTSLTSSFQTAFTPQITKSYASNNLDYLKSLVYSSSKMSYFLLLIISLPIIINIDFLLELWLVNVPTYANIFCVLCLMNGMLNALSAPLHYSVNAVGKIKWFHIVSSITYLSDLVFVYLLFYIEYPPYYAMIVKVMIMLIILLVRLSFAVKEIPTIRFSTYLQEVCLPILFLSLIFGFISYNIIIKTSSYLYSVVASFGIEVLLLLLIYCFGLRRNEKILLNTYLLKIKEIINK